MKDDREASFLLLNTELQVPQWKLKSVAVCKNVDSAEQKPLHKRWRLIGAILVS